MGLTKKPRTAIAMIIQFTAVLYIAFFALLAGSGAAEAQGKPPVLQKFLKKVPAAELVDGATSYGPLRADIPVVPVLAGSNVLGYAFITSDFVGTTGYSGKPIHVMVAIDPDGKLLQAELVKHSEPIVLIGIPNRKIKALTESYSGLDIIAEAAAGGSGQFRGQTPARSACRYKGPVDHLARVF